MAHSLELLLDDSSDQQVRADRDALAAAGLDRSNISLDTIDRERYAALTRRDRLDHVRQAIAAALPAGWTLVEESGRRVLRRAIISSSSSLVR